MERMSSHHARRCGKVVLSVQRASGPETQLFEASGRHNAGGPRSPATSLGHAVLPARPPGTAAWHATAVCPRPRQLALICAPFWELHRDRARRRARCAQADSDRETAWKGVDGGARTRVERSCSPRWAPTPRLPAERRRGIILASGRRAWATEFALVRAGHKRCSLIH